MKPFFRFALAAALLATLDPAQAASTVNLPAWVCGSSDTLFRSGFQDGESVQSDPSNGSGGTYPGNPNRTVAVSGIGNRTYDLHLPPGYTPTRSWPVLIALHGSGGSGWTSTTLADYVRTMWAARADAGGFIVMAPASNNSATGGWNPSYDIPILEAELTDLLAAYNIEQTRIYLWGFSAGAHYSHSLGLHNTDYFAAYAVSAGALQQFECGGYSDLQCSQSLSPITRKIPVDIHLGDSDPLYVSYGAGDDPIILANAGWSNGQNLHYTLVPGWGHQYPDAPQMAEIWANLCPFAVVP